MVSVVIPVYRDTDALVRTLDAAPLDGAEVVVAYTRDDRASLASLHASRSDVVWVEAPRGRARQMNAGAAAARGDVLVFLHADTVLPPQWRDEVATLERDPHASLGCFRFALDSPSPIARVLELGVRVRVRLFRLPYGDQALFVRRADFEHVGGYTDLPIMEDVDLVRRFRARGRLYRSRHPAVTSARKWQREGWIRQTARNLWLITRYFAASL